MVWYVEWACCTMFNKPAPLPKPSKFTDYFINSSLYQVRWHYVTSQSFNIYQQTSFSSSTKQRLILIQTMKLLESSIKKVENNDLMWLCIFLKKPQKVWLCGRNHAVLGDLYIWLVGVPFLLYGFDLKQSCFCRLCK